LGEQIDTITPQPPVSHGLEYDHIEGRPRFASRDLLIGGNLHYQFDLTRYMSRRDTSGRWVFDCDCDDQAAAVVALANLVKASAARVSRVARFGYMYANPMVGKIVPKVNNPFYRNVKFWFMPITGAPLPEEVTDLTDLHYIRWVDQHGNPISRGWPARSRFEFHSVASVGVNEYIADACIGQVRPSQGLTLGTYLLAYRDNSSAGEDGPMEWTGQDSQGKPVVGYVGSTATEHGVFIRKLDIKR
jgi:hypothetical protein